MDANKAREIVSEAGKRLLGTGLVSGTWGNISHRIDEKYMAITPSGQEYEKLKPEDIAIVNIETLEWQGKYKPSVEKGIHAGVYKSRKDVHAVLHTHSVNACVVAAARKEIMIEEESEKKQLGESIRTAKYAISGTKKLTKHALKGLENRNVILLANHGAVCLGKSMDDAFLTCEVMEKCCRYYIDHY